MINYERVSEKIFAIIKGHGHTLSMYREDGMDTTDAAEARRFFVAKPNYMITLDDETSTIKINKNSNLDLGDLESIMKQMKNLARENMLNTQVRVFGKEITPKDFSYQAKKFKDKQMNGISEASLSRMTGSKKTSYQTLESVKMIVRHRKAVDEDVRGSRSRQIKAIFLEQAGERFRFPHNHLAGARAMARHMYEGGNMRDTVGEYIIESVGNLIQLAEFVHYTRTNKLINETSEDVIKIVKENITALRGELKGLTGAKSYAKISEAIAAREINVLEEDDTDLQDMFTVHKFDEKFGATLPLVSRLLSEKQAWRAALLEASKQTIFMKAKEDLAEEDIMEFENPVQQVGYKIGKVAKRMVESGDLSNFVAKVAGKLIEGEKISEFEHTIVRNVMENGKIEESGKCDECGCYDCTCEANKRDTVESLGDAFELKMKMIEHEEIFEEDEEESCLYCDGPHHADDCKEYDGLDEAETKKTACSKCNGTGKEPGERDGQYDRKMFSAISCKACSGYGYGLSGDPARGLGKTKVTEEGDYKDCPDCSGGYTLDGKKCTRCEGAGKVYEDESINEAGGRKAVVNNIKTLVDRGEKVRSALGGAIGNIINVDDKGFATVQHRYRGKSSARLGMWQGLDIQKRDNEWVVFNNLDFDNPPAVDFELEEDHFDDHHAGNFNPKKLKVVSNGEDHDQTSEYWFEILYNGELVLTAQVTKDPLKYGYTEGITWDTEFMTKNAPADEEDIDVRGRPVTLVKKKLLVHFATPTGRRLAKEIEAFVNSSLDEAEYDDHHAGEVEAGAGMGMPMPDYAECPICVGTSSPNDPCWRCGGSGKADYVRGSRQDPFSGNYGVDVEDFLDGSEEDIF